MYLQVPYDFRNKQLLVPQAAANHLTFVMKTRCVFFQEEKWLFK
jgi:hypothetical protein